jgi:hypothetical protein
MHKVQCIEISSYTQWTPTCFGQSRGHRPGGKIKDGEKALHGTRYWTLTSAHFSQILVLIHEFESRMRLQLIILQFLQTLHYICNWNSFKTVVTGNCIRHFRVLRFPQLCTQHSVCLGVDAASKNSLIPTFRKNIVLSLSRVDRSLKNVWVLE